MNLLQVLGPVVNLSPSGNLSHFGVNKGLLASNRVLNSHKAPARVLSYCFLFCQKYSIEQRHSFISLAGVTLSPLPCSHAIRSSRCLSSSACYVSLLRFSVVIGPCGCLLNGLYRGIGSLSVLFLTLLYLSLSERLTALLAPRTAPALSSSS